jgi:hypothetical protein
MRVRFMENDTFEEINKYRENNRNVFYFGVGK